MSFPRNRIIVVSVLIVVLLTATHVYGFVDKNTWRAWGGGGEAKHPSGYSFTPNLKIHMEANPPYVGNPYNYEKIFFQDKGDYWGIDKMRRGSVFVVPEGYRVRCIASHTAVVSGKAGKLVGGGRVIYFAGTTVRYTYPSMLYIYKQ